MASEASLEMDGTGAGCEKGKGKDSIVMWILLPAIPLMEGAHNSQKGYCSLRAVIIATE